ncbi:SET domain-containing protein 4 [Phlebotomus papatasi]|uniref:SET domain-containing protein 4 n=1 Tax=Phlebotomus papatasi TaxID=29031 RepID=UPI00248455A9|nr:SET domain-containing protein 4 [Phlebotomus papatasi]
MNSGKKCPGIQGNVEKPSQEIIELCRFMKHQKNWKNDTMLCVREFPGTGRGLYSRKVLEGNSEIIDLPFDALISLKSISEDERFLMFMLEVSDGKFKWKMQTLLTIFLLWNWHLGDKSPWKAYLRSLPKELYHPHFCSVDELVASPVVSERVIDSVNQSEVKEVQKVLQNAVCPCCSEKFFPDLFPKRKFIEFYLICNSRTVYIPPDTIKSMIRESKALDLISNEPNMALAPFLDLINHSDSTKTLCSLAKRGPGFFYTLKTSTKFDKGQQIFINYGPHCNMKLLIEYGFFLPENSNEFIEVSMTDIEELIKKLKRNHQNLQIPSNKFRYIRDHNLHEKMFIEASRFSHNLEIVLHFLLLDRNIYENNYHQVVFGNIPEESCLTEYKILLINQLLDHYRESLRNLQALESLTKCGKIVRKFLECRIEFMTKCLNKNQ